MAVVSSIFIDFRRFHEITKNSLFFMDLYVFLKISHDFLHLHGFQGPEVSRPLPTFAAEMMALKKFYSIPDGCCFIDFHRFPKISWEYINFNHFHGFVWISWDFIWFRAFPWMSGARGFAAFATVCHRDDALRETLTRSQMAAVSSIFAMEALSCFWLLALL